MANIKQRFYLRVIIILVLGLLASAIWVWQLWAGDYRHQDKVYSGAKLVSGGVIGEIYGLRTRGSRDVR